MIEVDRVVQGNQERKLYAGLVGAYVQIIGSRKPYNHADIKLYIKTPQIEINIQYTQSYKLVKFYFLLRDFENHFLKSSSYGWQCSSAGKLGFRRNRMFLSSKNLYTV